jgi:hypothetical protein
MRDLLHHAPHEGVIGGFGFIEPVEVGFFEPAFFAQVRLQLAHVVAPQALVFGRALFIAAELAGCVIGVASPWQAVNGQHKGVEAELVQIALRGGIEA